VSETKPTRKATKRKAAPPVIDPLPTVPEPIPVQRPAPAAPEFHPVVCPPGLEPPIKVRRPIEERIRELQERKAKADAAPEPVGIPCPKCGCCEFFVVYVRKRRSHILRRRECRHCGKRITTREKAS
jgi:hypothetical protein